jgi:5-methylcytosine-specific restriction endonuclease McrA
VTAAQIRSSRRWKRAREIALRGASHCQICGRPLDFSAPARSKWSPSVDHIIALARGGEPFAQSNLRVLHLGCNSRLGAVMGNRNRGRASGFSVPRSVTRMSLKQPRRRALVDPYEYVERPR